MSNTTVVVVADTIKHGVTTEGLIIISQTVFFVMIFLLLKNALIDRRGMMYDYNRIREEKLQLAALFFAILVFLSLLMIPVLSYEFVHLVIPLTFLVVFSLIGYEIYAVYQQRTLLPSLKPTMGGSSPTVITSTPQRSRNTAFDY